MRGLLREARPGSASAAGCFLPMSRLNGLWPSRSQAIARLQMTAAQTEQAPPAQRTATSDPKRRRTGSASHSQLTCAAGPGTHMMAMATATGVLLALALRAAIAGGMASSKACTKPKQVSQRVTSRLPGFARRAGASRSKAASNNAPVRSKPKAPNALVSLGRSAAKLIPTQRPNDLPSRSVVVVAEPGRSSLVTKCPTMTSRAHQPAHARPAAMSMARAPGSRSAASTSLGFANPLCLLGRDLGLLAAL
mmetsp:Transcript_29761/g.59997  ORF Transcript_29761/g.59997 Transcript_29761/m.59997 type:complete len:250 (+) Transcript_29761:168-917(+)